MSMDYAGIFDSHAHYDDSAFDEDRDVLLSSLPDKGVCAVVSCGCDIKSVRTNQLLSKKHEYLYYSSGFHPDNLDGAKLDDLNEIASLAKDEKCVAIGEIGLDYHWMSSEKEIQKNFFIHQIELASQLSLPVIVHDREAHEDILNILKMYKPKGVLHCFSGSREMAKEIIKIGMYIGLNGVATFKNARKSLEVLREIPLERLVIETDCPYLAPVPYRGKRNDSSLVPYIAQKIAHELNMDTQTILNITADNAKKLYNI